MLEIHEIQEREKRKREENKWGERVKERALAQQPRPLAYARCQLQCFPFDAHRTDLAQG